MLALNKASNNAFNEGSGGLQVVEHNSGVSLFAVDFNLVARFMTLFDEKYSRIVAFLVGGLENSK